MPTATPKKKPTAKRAPAARRAKKEAPATPVSAPISVPVTETIEQRDYLRGIGRRKEAVATVRLYKNGTGRIVVNNRPYTEYFSTFKLRQTLIAPLEAAGQSDKVDLSVRVAGGGLRGQSDAVRLGIARALLGLNPTFRRGLRKVGMLTRDARIKERKKPGLKRARRAPQWQKR